MRMRRWNAWSRLEQVSWNKCPGTSDETNMQDVNVENQILITGAGPAGLALAAELSRLGVKPLIIDRQAAGANTSRACVVHARTMEVLRTARRDAGLACGGRESTHLSHSRPRPAAPDDRLLEHSEYVPVHADDSPEPGRADPPAAPRRHGLQREVSCRKRS
jgi:hypothetical protein